MSVPALRYLNICQPLIHGAVSSLQIPEEEIASLGFKEQPQLGEDGEAARVEVGEVDHGRGEPPAADVLVELGGVLVRVHVEAADQSEVSMLRGEC